MSRRTRGYVSGKISADTYEEVDSNLNALEYAGMKLREAGYAPFVPATDIRVLGDDLRGGLSHQDWLACDLPWVEMADFVYLVPGWEDSPGAQIEVQWAQDAGIPVYTTIEAVIDHEPTLKHGDARFHRMLMKMGRLHDLKQQDYGTAGDPFANVRASQDYGVRPYIGGLIRMNDKVTRLKNFAQRGALANESFVDSLLDLAVYAIITFILYEEEEE